MLVIPLTALATAWQRLGQGLWGRLVDVAGWRRHRSKKMVSSHIQMTSR
jgi:hypothetical protein